MKTLFVLLLGVFFFFGCKGYSYPVLPDQPTTCPSQPQPCPTQPVQPQPCPIVQPQPCPTQPVEPQPVEPEPCPQQPVEVPTCPQHPCPQQPVELPTQTSCPPPHKHLHAAPPLISAPIAIDGGYAFACNAKAFGIPDQFVLGPFGQVGHVGYGDTLFEAKSNALYACEDYYQDCYLSACYQ